MRFPAMERRDGRTQGERTMGLRIDSHTPAHNTANQRNQPAKTDARPPQRTDREPRASALDDHLSRHAAALEIALQNQVAAESAVTDIDLANESATYIRDKMLQLGSNAASTAKLVPNAVLELLQ